MKNFKLLFLALALTTTFFTGCKKDEKTDIRDSVTGTYFGNQNYTIQWSKISNSYADSSQTSSVTITIANDNTAGDGIIITELGSPDFTYKANGVSAASNGLTFNIPQQNVNLAVNGYNFSVAINGYTNYVLGSGNFDGGYNNSTKQVQLGYSGTIQVQSGQMTLSVPFTVLNTVTKK